MEINQPSQVSVTPSASAPVADVAPVTPVTPSSPAPEPAPTPAVNTPTESTPATPDVAPAETKVENILGDSVAKPEAKDAVKQEGDKTAEPIKTETKPEGEAVVPVYKFKLPENTTLDKEPMDAFTKVLGEIELGKLDHASLQEKGQALIDMHVKGVQQSIERLNDYYSQFHENQKKEWFESFKKDPELGGAKLEETVGNLRGAVETYGGTAEQVAEFRQIMKDTGVGNHPAVIRLLNNMDAKIRKYETESDNGNGGSNRMVPGARPAPSKVKDYALFYTGGGR